MKQLFTKKNLIIAIVLLVVFILFVLARLTINQTSMEGKISSFAAQNDEASIPEELTSEEDKEELQREPAIVYIDIKGAVLEPDVYGLKDGSRVQDAIKMAGGFLESADQTKINLAARVEDEMVLYVPEIGEEVEVIQAEVSAQSEESGTININKATSEQLQSLPGIGASKAESIISYREENGPFKRVEDLINVSGIGEKSFEQLKDKITIR